MADLIEACLDTIFGYLTPVEWVRISEVCQHWRTVVKKQWQKITSITYMEHDLYCALIGRLLDKKPVVVSDEDAKKIVLHAAQHCRSFKAFTALDKENYAIMFGPLFHYKFKSFSTDDVLQILADNMTELTEVQLLQSAKTELMQLFFQKNKIKSITLLDSDDFWRHVPTDGIEKLHVDFKNGYNFGSFEGHFQNLQTLELGLSFVELNNLQEVLSDILPHVLGIKSLNLFISAPDHPGIRLTDIVKCSKLEELKIEFDWPEDHPGYCTEDYEFPRLNKKFKLSPCTQLRVVNLNNFMISDNVLRHLLLLPNLEQLDVGNLVDGFRLMRPLPEIEKLVEFGIQISRFATLDITNLVNAVEKMPNLRMLTVRTITQEQILKLTCEAIFLAASQGKDVVMKIASREENCKMLKIERKKNEQENVPVLTLKFVVDFEKTVFSDVTAFVQKRLKSHRTIILEV